MSTTPSTTMMVSLRSPKDLHSALLAQTSANTSDPVKEAFDEAVRLFNSKFTDDERKRIWLRDKHRMADVQKMVDNAKEKYDERQQSKARKWLIKLSSRVVLYGAVLDTLSQHHPEYVSLVWGAIKFIFMGVLNQEKLIKELAKALTLVADALRQAELYAFLYPTDVMRDLHATLNAQIIRFVQRAAKWYAEGPVSHMFTAIARPYELRFQDLVDDIAAQSHRIHLLALAMLHVEIRDSRIEQREMRAAADEYHKLQYTGILDTNRRVCEMQFSQIMFFAETSNLTDPDVTRLYYASMRNRHRRQKGTDNDLFRQSQQLQSWGSNPNSSLVIVNSSFQDRHIARDFAADAIDLIMDEKIPVVWALQPRNDQSANYTPMDVLKQLVSQALKQNHTLLNERSAALNAVRFQSARTEEDWFNLLGLALEGLPQIYVIIDLEALGRQLDGQYPWPYAFIKLFEELRSRRIPTVVKVAFVSYRTPFTGELPAAMNNVISIPRKIPGKAKCAAPRGKSRLPTRGRSVRLFRTA